MDGRSDRTGGLDRTRLCELGGIARAKHIRWTKNGLLREARRYSELDLIRAVALDELTEVLRPKRARIAWNQVASAISHPAGRLEVVFSLATTEAWPVRTAQALDRTLPRDEPLVIVRLDLRIKKARERLEAFRARSASAKHNEQDADPDVHVGSA